MGFADKMLAAGCVKHIGAVHGERIQVLEGPDEGKFFDANILETQTDQILVTEESEDPRAVMFLRFDDDKPKPNIEKPTRVQTANGKIWIATKQDFSGYLTTDFKLIEVVSGKDA